MKIRTIIEEKILSHATVGTFKLMDGKSIPAITVGEKGRGRELGVLPVQLTTTSYKKWSEKGVVNISYGRLGQTKSGRPKLIETETPEDNFLLLVLLTPIGFRGNNRHHLPEAVEVIVKGRIAQGIAGGMGSGSQMVIRTPPDAGEILIEIGGRRYGQPTKYVYRVKDGEITIQNELDIDTDELLPLD